MTTKEENLIFEPLYVVYLDEKFIGVIEKEDYITDLIEDYTDNISMELSEDYIDRVDIKEINVNRWYAYDEHNSSDKLSDDNIMCYNYQETENCTKLMNKLFLEKERQNAKIRALQL